MSVYVKKSNIRLYPEIIGELPGEICGRKGCTGVMEDMREGSCHCFAVIPPCSYCTTLRTMCSVCETEVHDSY